MMIKRIILILAGIFLASEFFGYNSADFDAEKTRFLIQQNRMVKEMLPSYLAMKKSEPLMSMEDEFSWSLDLSYGGAGTPFYVYGIPKSDYKVFSDFTNIYGGNNEFIPGVNMSFLAGLPYHLVGVLDASYFPDVSFYGAARGNFKAGGSLYYRFLEEKFTFIGLLTGAGYSYTAGTIKRPLDVNFTDNGYTAVFKGDMKTDWSYSALDAELFVHKTFFVVNFYGRGNYYYMLGKIKSELAGSTSLIDNSNGQGLVLAGGMEIILGLVKLNFEAGRDWLSQSVYGNVGLRIGL